MSISIILADDHVILRQGLRLLLDEIPDLQVLDEASDGLETIKKVKALHPDILVLDLKIPGLSGLEVTRHVYEECPSTRVVILSMYEREGYVAEALRSGASAYVVKGADASELIQTIRQVMRGREYLSASFNANAIQTYLQRLQADDLDPYEILTNREKDVLKRVAEGYSSPEIAEQLTISVRTVETHRSHIMQKLGLRNQTELVRYALSRGIISLDDDESHASKR